MGDTAVSRVERRREQGRVYARRHYYKSLNHVQKLQAEVQELEKELDFGRFHAGAVSPAVSSSLLRLQKLQTTREELLRANSVLRERRDEYLKWEFALGQQVERHWATKDPAQKTLKHTTEGHRRWRLIAPLTVEECHVMTKIVYSQIKAFNEKEQSVPLGSPVLGWSDRRRVENGRFRFSLQKVFPNRSAFELMKRSWAIVSSAQTTRFYSANMKMRCELVQQVDPSNVVQYLEYEVRGIDPRTGADTLMIGRSLAFQAIFETESGYITIFLSLDPHRLANWPEACDPMPPGASVHYETTPGFTWTSFERAGSMNEDCRLTYVGGIRNENIRAFWSIELLLMVLRWESIVVGPPFTLLNQSDDV